MSTLLLDQVIAHVRGAFSTADVREVREYAGEFSGAEIMQTSFSAPAILIACMGWKAGRSERMTGRHTRIVRLAAFVVTKNATSREARMREAMRLSERLGITLREWAPQDTSALAIAPIEDDAQAENLYGRAVDEKGLALWMVSWQQACRPLVPPAQLWDLLAIDITDNTRTTVPADATALPGALTVTEDVRFNPY